MLSFFRRALSSWMVIGLLSLLMIAFIVTGVGTPSSMGSLGGVGAGEIARAGDRALSVNDVSERMQLELRQAREQNPEMTMAQLLQGRTLDTMIEQLTDILAIRAFAEKHGMVVSDKLGDAEIASISAFHGATGRFDENRYRQALSSRGISETQFRADIDQGIAVRHTLLPISASAGASQDLVLPYAALFVERRTGSVVEFRNSAFAGGPAPTDAEINAFYALNRAAYTVPEQRVIRYAMLDKAMVAKSAAPTDAEIAAQYRKDSAKYTAREQRDLTQIIVQDQKVAQTLAQKVRSGTSMADAARSAGVDAIAIKAAEKASYTKQSADAVAGPVFAGASGAVIGPVKASLGWYVVKVDAIKTVGGKSLGEARAEIAAALSKQKGEDAFANLLASIDQAVSDGQTFEDVAKAKGLTIQTSPALTATGAAPAQPGYRFDPSLQAVLKDAFQAEPDDDPALVPLGPDKDVFYDLDRVIAAAPKPLSEIRQQVVAAFLADRANKAARKAADAALAKLKSGAAMSTLGGAVRTISARRADILASGKAPEGEIAQLLDLRRGKPKLTRSADKQGWIIVTLDKIEPGDLRAEPGIVSTMQGQLSNVIGQEYTAQFATAAKAAQKIERNEDAIKSLRRSLAGAPAQ